MKTIGLIGGMSWESSLEYYRIINQQVKACLGEPHSAKCILYSVDFAEIERLQHAEEWNILGNRLTKVGESLEGAGAECIVICTNTMHLLAEELGKTLRIPILHIADAAANGIKSQGITQVGLLGTKFTMEKDFYSKRLKDKHGIDVILPNAKQRELVHRVIYKELVSGIISAKSRKEFQGIISDLHKRGADGVVLGCTEIPLLIKERDVEIPIFDTTSLHAKMAVEWALS